MPRPIDAAYLAAAIAASPVWLPRMIRTGKIRTDWPARFGRGEDLPKATGRRVLLHAVSVGEVNATDLLVDQLRAGEPAIEPVVATPRTRDSREPWRCSKGGVQSSGTPSIRAAPSEDSSIGFDRMRSALWNSKSGRTS